MREKIRDRERLLHMIEAIDKIDSAQSRYPEEALTSDPILFYGMVKCLEIIGEAAYKLTESTRSRHPEIPWSAVIGMRHVLVHGYYQIKAERILATIETDLLPLRSSLTEILKTFTD